MEKRRIWVGLGIGLIIVSALVFGILFITRNTGKTEKVITAEEAQSSLTDMVARIGPTTAEPVKASVEYTSDEDVAAEELPELSDDSIKVPATTDTYAEVWSSPRRLAQAPTAGCARWQSSSTSLEPSWTASP